MSTDNKIWFSAGEIALLGERFVAGLPGTMRGCTRRAQREGWVSREVKGSGGPGGILTEYQPPTDVLALIQSFLAANPEFFKPKQRKNLPKFIVPTPGSNPDAAGRIARELAASYRDDFCVFIDKYVNVSGSAGPGAEVHEEAIVKVRVDARLLRERVGSNFDRIKIASVSGDSMEPTLSHGDQVLVDTSCERFIDDAIYAIQQDGHLRFKRIQLKLDGSIVVRSDGSTNAEAYSAEEAQRFFVVGMVIPFKFGRFKI